MLQFATAENLEEATRQLAAEFLVVLCEAREKAPGMMRKLPTFSQSIFHIMLNFLLDIEVRLSARLTSQPLLHRAREVSLNAHRSAARTWDYARRIAPLYVSCIIHPGNTGDVTSHHTALLNEGLRSTLRHGGRWRDSASITIPPIAHSLTSACGHAPQQLGLFAAG